MKQLVIVLGFMLLIFLSKQQDQCSYSCYDENSTNFLCNGRKCSSFYWPQSTIYGSGINCKGGGINCYYNAGMVSNTLYKFIACNDSFSNCLSCYNSSKCSSCNTGYSTYYSDITDIQNEHVICKKCRDLIPGCQMCRSGSTCDQCDSNYLSIGGICYENDGKTIAKFVPDSNSFQNQIQARMTGIETETVGIEVAVIIIAVISVLSFLVILLYIIRMWIMKKKYSPLMQQN